MRDRGLFGEDPLGFKTPLREDPSWIQDLLSEMSYRHLYLPLLDLDRVLFVFLGSSTCVTLFLLVECSLMFFPRSPPRVIRVLHRDPLQT